jgi:hypothetical protein
LGNYHTAFEKGRPSVEFLPKRGAGLANSIGLLFPGIRGDGGDAFKITHPCLGAFAAISLITN